MADGLRNVQEAAAWLGISPNTLYEFTAARSVPFTKVGRHIRFTQEHLDAIVAAGEEPVVVPPSRLQVVPTTWSGRLRTHPPSGPSTPPPPSGPKLPASKGRVA